MTNGKTLLDEAIKQVEINAAEDWLSEADAAVDILAAARISFTTDDVWQKLTTKTHEPRAMGAVMLRAARDGLIKSTGQWAESNRPASHRRPLRVWVGQ
jgi:hypothetical protein